MNRPVGITILAWAAILWGALAILIGILGTILGLYETAVGSVALNSGFVGGANPFALGVVTTVESALAAVVGVFDIVLGIGLLRLAHWSWVLGHVVMIFNIAVNLIGVVFAPQGWPAALVSVVVAGAILYYLRRPEVAEAFRRRPGTPAGDGVMPPPPTTVSGP